MSFRSYAEANDMQSATTKGPSPEVQRVGAEYYLTQTETYFKHNVSEKGDRGTAPENFGYFPSLESTSPAGETPPKQPCESRFIRTEY